MKVDNLTKDVIVRYYFHAIHNEKTRTEVCMLPVVGGARETQEGAMSESQSRHQERESVIAAALTKNKNIRNLKLYLQY